MKTKIVLTFLLAMSLAVPAWAASPKYENDHRYPQVDHGSGQSKNFDWYPQLF